MTFRLPVSRDLLDMERAACAELRAMLMQANARNDLLVHQIIGLKREGFVSAPPPPPVPEEPKDPPGFAQCLDVLDSLQLPRAEHAREEARMRAWIADGMDAAEAARRLIEGQ